MKRRDGEATYCLSLGQSSQYQVFGMQKACSLGSSSRMSWRGSRGRSVMLSELQWIINQSINHQSSFINHQSSIINHQSILTLRLINQSSIKQSINHSVEGFGLRSHRTVVWFKKMRTRPLTGKSHFESGCLMMLRLGRCAVRT